MLPTRSWSSTASNARRRTDLKTCALAALLAWLACAQEGGVYTYNFANGTVSPNDVFTKERGYGFDPRARPGRITGGVASVKPFVFSVAVPPGTYRVTATLGDPNAACVTDIRVAPHRLMIEKAETEPGRTRQVGFSVAVSAPELSLEFGNRRPCLDALEIRRLDDAAPPNGK